MDDSNDRTQRATQTLCELSPLHEVMLLAIADFIARNPGYTFDSQDVACEELWNMHLLVRDLGAVYTFWKLTDLGDEVVRLLKARVTAGAFVAHVDGRKGRVIDVHDDNRCTVMWASGGTSKTDTIALRALPRRQEDGHHG